MTEGGAGRFRYYPMTGECRCGSVETMYVGETLIDEKCCHCGVIVGGGYLAATGGGNNRSTDTGTDQEGDDE